MTLLTTPPHAEALVDRDDARVRIDLDLGEEEKWCDGVDGGDDTRLGVRVIEEGFP